MQRRAHGAGTYGKSGPNTGKHAGSSHNIPPLHVAKGQEGGDRAQAGQARPRRVPVRATGIKKLPSVRYLYKARGGARCPYHGREGQKGTACGASPTLRPPTISRSWRLPTSPCPTRRSARVCSAVGMAGAKTVDALDELVNEPAPDAGHRRSLRSTPANLSGPRANGMGTRSSWRGAPHHSYVTWRHSMPHPLFRRGLGHNALAVRTCPVEPLYPHAF